MRHARVVLSHAPTRVDASGLLAVLLAITLAAQAPAATVDPALFAPDATVEGRTQSQWSAAWWQSVFATPVYAADGTTVTHPQFDAGLAPGDTVDVNHARASDDGRVTFLYGSFFGGTIDRTVTVPAGKPIFVPIANSEWSNPDTAAAPDYTSLPGNHTPQQLAAFAKIQADSISGAGAELDGRPLDGILNHRFAASFQYTQPAQHSITQVFFDAAYPGPVDSAADGLYLMLRGLEPGEHTLKFSASSPDLSGTPPQLGAFDVDMTYHITAVGASAIPLPPAAFAGLPMLAGVLAIALRRRAAAG